MRSLSSWWLLVVVSLTVVAGTVRYGAAVSDAWTKVERSPGGGRDFASYHFAARAVAAGDNPYVQADLRRAARAEGRARSVHPYFYPPPFLASVAWTVGRPLPEAYRIWFWLDALCAVLAFGALALWWRPLHTLTPAMVALLLAYMTAVPNNHVMGQMNHPVLLLVVFGLWADDRGRPRLGGTLVGLACMAKMSPALFVLLWVRQGRVQAVAAAVLTAVLSSILVLPWMGPGVQGDFYARVLPGFASGDYNGLTVPIGLFGNHSVPDVFHQLWPGGQQLSSVARWASRLVTFGLVGVFGLAFRRPDPGTLTSAAQLAAVAVLLLLVPVYTYEHHLVWAVPAAVVGMIGVVTGRLPKVWAPVLLLAVVALCWDLQDLKRLHRVGGVQGLLMKEAKHLALWVLMLGAFWLGRQGRTDGGTGTSQPDQVPV